MEMNIGSWGESMSGHASRGILQICGVACVYDITMCLISNSCLNRDLTPLFGWWDLSLYQFLPSIAPMIFLVSVQGTCLFVGLCPRRDQNTGALEVLVLAVEYSCGPLVCSWSPNQHPL